MPRFLARIFYALRGKRRVRLHLINDGPSLGGILLGRWAGHYILMIPQLMSEPDQAIALEGLVEVPAEKVLFVQVIV